MVADIIQHASLYHGLSSGIKTALQYITSNDLLAVKPGRHELSDGCYAMVQDYEPSVREGKRWEAHRKYIDVQFMAAGSEMIGCADCSSLRSVEDYSNDSDVEWFDGEGSFLRVEAGTFVVLFPHEAHMPGVSVGEPGQVRKVVVKVPVER